MKQIATLWLDDELSTDREPALRPWKRALDQLQSSRLLKLTCCNCLREFARLLQGGATADVSESGASFGLLVIDIMLTEEIENSYACLGFPAERVNRFEAGAQIAALLRSSMFDLKRPVWLQPYIGVPMLALSSSPSLQSQVERRIGHSRLNGLELVSKSLKRRAAGDGVDAGPEFQAAIKKLLGG